VSDLVLLAKWVSEMFPAIKQLNGYKAA